ncbi:serpin B6 domain protein [Oesophagostomum dentatum]|uniref:Serpin B6 domain protein n=1 Tax=Oesophagostomum dentatum TaxID=61180 RepID=A0A0B1SZ21_OESDE|nr:serpin B6 domain protein [Oesophagostomum dentatum]
MSDPYLAVVVLQESLMNKNELKDCRYANRHGIQLLTLPYMGKSYEFVIFLPSQRGKFEEFRKNLTAEMMGELLKSARSLSSGIDVTIPKFKLTSQPQMKSMLQRLGIKQLFGNGCDLRGISEKEEISVDDVIHKAIIEVNEEGTEAAAVTAVRMITTSISAPMEPIRFRADHPFVYGIYCGDEPIFFGQYC